jgi:EmrB/QacA subfamily drug resistance transporter
MSSHTRHQQHLILATCCMGLLIVSMDATVLNIALPSIRAELGTNVAGMQWTVDAYTLVLASLLVLAGSTADRIGRRKVLKTGLMLFTLGSVLCSLAPNISSLVVFRMVQAVGGSMLSPVTMSIIGNTFTAPRERARAIGIWSSANGVSMAMGPIVGGLLVEMVGWRAIFWINVPIGLVALLLTWRFVPESRAPKPRRPDPIGQCLVIVLLASVTYAIIEAPGSTAGAVLLPAALAVAALAGLLAYELRRDEPLIDLRFFRSAPFSGASVIAVSAFAALTGFLFLNTLYLQGTRGLSPLQAGLYMLPMAVLTFASGPLSGRLVASLGPRLPLAVTGTSIAACGLLFAGFEAESTTALLFAGYILFGLGFGMVNAPIANTVVSAMPASQAGLASAIASTSRQTGATLGVAVVGSILAAGTNGTATTNFLQASRPAWWTITGCGLAILVTGLATSGHWAQRTAQRTAKRLEPTAAQKLL